MGFEHRIRVVVAAAAFAVVLPVLAGCVTTESCISWVDFETAQDAFDGAESVVIAQAERTGDTIDEFGARVPVYRLDIGDVLKGEVDSGSLDVSSTQITCIADGHEYPGGLDPLDADDDLIVFLTRSDDGRWRTMTPHDAALPLPDDGTLPFDPADQ